MPVETAAPAGAREPDPYTAAARAVTGDMRSITLISVNDIKAMGLLICVQHAALEEIATVAEQCVASVNDRKASVAVLDAMARHGFFDHDILQKLTEATHEQKEQSESR